MESLKYNERPRIENVITYRLLIMTIGFELNKAKFISMQLLKLTLYDQYHYHTESMIERTHFEDYTKEDAYYVFIDE